MRNGVNIFCSYAHKDRSFLSDLKAYLFPLQRLNLITTWSDTDIRPGSNQDEEIQAHFVDRRITFHFFGTISFRWKSLNEPGKRIEAVCESSSSAR